MESVATGDLEDVDPGFLCCRYHVCMLIPISKLRFHKPFEGDIPLFQKVVTTQNIRPHKIKFVRFVQLGHSLEQSLYRYYCVVSDSDPSPWWECPWMLHQPALSMCYWTKSVFGEEQRGALWRVLLVGCKNRRGVKENMRVQGLLHYWTKSSFNILSLYTHQPLWKGEVAVSANWVINKDKLQQRNCLVCFN